MRKKLAVLLAIIMVIELSPEVVLGATLTTWNVVQAPESVLSEIYQFDGECYIGKRGNSWILVDSDMNLLFRDAPNKIIKIGDGFYQVNNSNGEWGIINSKGDTIVPMTKERDKNYSPLRLGVNSQGKFCFSSYIGLYNEEGKRITSYGDYAGAKKIGVSYYSTEYKDGKKNQEVGKNGNRSITISELLPASYICVSYIDDSWKTLSEEYYNFDGEKISKDDYSKYGIGDVKEEEKTSRELKMESYLEQCAEELHDEYDSQSSYHIEEIRSFIYSITICKSNGAEVEFYYYFDNDGTCIKEKQEEYFRYFLTEDTLYYYAYGVVFRLNKDVDPEYLQEQEIENLDGSVYLQGVCYAKDGKTTIYDSDGKKCVEVNYAPDNWFNGYYYVIKADDGYYFIDYNESDGCYYLHDEKGNVVISATGNMYPTAPAYGSKGMVAYVDDDFKNRYYYDLTKKENLNITEMGELSTGETYVAYASGETATCTIYNGDYEHKFELTAPFEVDSWAVEPLREQDGYVFYAYNKYPCSGLRESGSSLASMWWSGANMGAQYIIAFDENGNEIISGTSEDMVFFSEKDKKIYTMNSSDLPTGNLPDEVQPIKAMADEEPIVLATAAPTSTPTEKPVETPTEKTTTEPTTKSSAAPTKEPTVTSSTAPTEGPTTNQTNVKNSPTTSESAEHPKKGDVIKNKKAEYTITELDEKSATVAYVKPMNKNITTVSVPKTIAIGGMSYKVTAIQTNAFKGCKKLKKVTIGSNVVSIGNKVFSGNKKLKTITIKSKKLASKNLSNKAFGGISSKVTLIVPKSKVKTYKKLFRKKGLSKKIKIKN